MTGTWGTRARSIGFLLGMVGLGVLAGMVGCGGSSGPTAVTITGPTSLSVDPGDSATFSATVANDSKSAGVTWSLSGTGCTGAACGTLSGSSTTGVTYTAPSPVTSALTVTITATSVAKTTITGTITVSVPANPAITTPAGALAGGTVGTAYSLTLTEAGGISPYTWTVTTGTLPAGLSLSSGGAITGTPTAAGSASVTVKLTDSGSPALTATANFTIAIAAPPTIKFSTTSLPGGTVGTAYSASVLATGGAGTLTYAVASGSLPAGVTMSTGGVLSGKPTGGGTSTFTVKATDAYGDTGTSGTLSIAVAYPALTVTTASLPNGVVGDAYSATLTAAGGTGTGYTWMVTGGNALSAESLTLATNGGISGTPSVAENAASVSVKVTDSGGNTATATLTLTIGPALAVTTTSLPNGTVGTAYSATLAASGGTGTGETWTVTGGTGLSAVGLSLGTNGTIGGTPNAVETAGSVSVKVTDSAGNTATATLALTVVYATLSITTTNIPGATVGSAYSEQFAATGGSGHYSWAATTNLAGLTGETLTFTTGGLLSGTPTTVEDVPFVVTVTDTTTNDTANAPYTLVVSAAAAASCTHDGSGNALLSGKYAFLLGGFDPNGNHYYQIGDFAANGSGTISGGNGDVNSSGFATQGEQQYAFSGTYSIGSTDDRGIMTVANTNTTATGLPATAEYCFAADTVTGGVAQSGRMIEADGSGFVVSGFFELQGSGDFANSALSTGFAMGVQGVNSNSSGPARAAVIGELTFNGTGGVTSGQFDVAQYDPQTASTSYQSAQALGSGSTYSIASTGRGTLTLATGGNGTPFVFYVAGSGTNIKVLLLSASNINADTVLLGQAQEQTTSSFTTANVKGPAVLLGIGADNVSSTSTPLYVDDAVVGEVNLNGSGSISVLIDENDGGTIESTVSGTGTYSVSSLGYVTLSGVGNHSPSFYLYAPGAGFGLTGDTGVQFLYLQPQTIPSGGFTDTSISGNYALGTIPPVAYSANGTGTTSGNPFPSVTEGTLVAGTSTLALTQDQNQAPGLPADLSVDQTGSYPWVLDATYGASAGRFTVTGNGGGVVLGYIVSPTQVFVMDYRAGDDPSVEEAEHQ